MAIANARELAACEIEGRERWTHWVKNVTQTTTANVWFDLTGSSGNPRAKQWFDASPLTAQQIRQSTDAGMWHGGNLSGTGRKKHLRRFSGYFGSGSGLPMTVILADYLLYYPSVDDGNPDPQVMDNTATLPRYTSGDGVQIMAVTISSRTGGQTFSVTYTNSAGQTGRVTSNHTQNAFAAPGTITTSQQAVNSPGSPFMALQGADSGVRAIESVQMNGADTGFFALVLVRPLATLTLRETTAWYEKDLWLMGPELEEVQDDAYLSMLVLPTSASLSGQAVRGAIQTIWN